MKCRQADKSYSRAGSHITPLLVLGISSLGPTTPWRCEQILTAYALCSVFQAEFFPSRGNIHLITCLAHIWTSWVRKIHYVQSWEQRVRSVQVLEILIRHLEECKRRKYEGKEIETIDCHLLLLQVIGWMFSCGEKEGNIWLHSNIVWCSTPQTC